MSTDKQVISLQIPSNLYYKLKQSAEDEATTVSALVRRILISFYKGDK